jgi:hypothetical protein
VKQGFAAAQAWQRLAEFLALFALVTPAPAVLERVRALHLERHWAFWDVTRLSSEDLPGRTKIESLQSVGPFA